MLFRRGILGAALALLGAIASSGTVARSPRTGDLATVPSIGVDSAVGESAFETGITGSVAQEFYWSGANAIRGTLGKLSLPARAETHRGRVSAYYLSAGVSHNWLRGAIFPYVVGTLGLYSIRESGDSRRDSLEAGLYGAAGMEVRLGEAITFRLEAGLHAWTGAPPDTVLAGSAGVSFYY